MTPPGKVTVPGFMDNDTYDKVLSKAAKGLGIDKQEDLLLIVSNGLVIDAPLSNGKPWTLGNYIAEMGGAQVRGKRTFGVCVTDDDSDEV